MSCTNCVFVTKGHRCPVCRKISTPNISLEHVRTQERLYGTAYGSGRYNEGLGTKTYGKQDFLRQAETKGLRSMEPGEHAKGDNGKAELSKRARAEQEKIVSRTISRL